MTVAAPVTTLGSPLRDRLRPCVELIIPGFEKHNTLQTHLAYQFEPLDCRLWYRRGVERMLAAIGSSFLPVYRMFDGEYIFAVGDPNDRLAWWQLPPRLAVRGLRQSLQRRRHRQGHRSGTADYGWEEYTPAEKAQSDARYVSCLRTIAQEGYLALGLHNRPIAERFLPRLFDWFDSRQVVISPDNYLHFYFVYAMLHGPDRLRLLGGRQVLVVTGLTPGKRAGIARGLQAAGVAGVQFLAISSQKALLDRLDLSSVVGPIDLALVGAGVGSANILVQLAPLRTLCLDAGFVLSTLADPDLRWKRPYCIPDAEFDRRRVAWV